MAANHYFTLQQAAAYLGFTMQTFTAWCRRNFISPPVNGAWPRESLDQGLEQIQRIGVQHDNPSRRNSVFKKIPNTHHVWKKLEQGDGAGHWLFYFRPTGEPLPGPWGGPAFMSALVACERRRAAQLAAKSADIPTDPPKSSSPLQPRRARRYGRAEVPADQSPSAAQPSCESTLTASANQPFAVTANQWLTAAHPGPALAPDIPKSVTRRDADRQRQPGTAATLEALLAPSPPITSSTRIFLTPEEVSDRWRGRIAVETMSNWRSTGVGPPATRVGRTILYRLDLLEQWERHQTNVHPPLNDPGQRSATVRNS
jgi:hypothetical protein